jgi:acetyltransferase
MQSTQMQRSATRDHARGGWNAGTRGGGEILIRAAQPSDAASVQRFVRGLSRETRHKRFFAPIHELSPEQLERLTSNATADDLSLLVLDCLGEIIGMGQCAATGEGAAEFAVVVGEDWQRRGVGTTLLGLLMEHARSRQLVSLAGFVLADNQAMLGLAAKLGLSLVRDADPALVRVETVLNDGQAIREDASTRYSAQPA